MDLMDPMDIDERRLTLMDRMTYFDTIIDFREKAIQ